MKCRVELQLDQLPSPLKMAPGRRSHQQSIFHQQEIDLPVTLPPVLSLWRKPLETQNGMPQVPFDVGDPILTSEVVMFAPGSD